MDKYVLEFGCGDYKKVTKLCQYIIDTKLYQICKITMTESIHYTTEFIFEKNNKADNTENNPRLAYSICQGFLSVYKE